MATAKLLQTLLYRKLQKLYIYLERNGKLKKFPSKNLNSDINKINGIKIKSNIKNLITYIF